MLSDTVYEAKKIVRPVGLKIEKNHAYCHNYVLFCGENEDLDHCPECGITRYKHRKNGGNDGEDNNKRKMGTPRKVAWYFYLISRLQRMLLR